MQRNAFIIFMNFYFNAVSETKQYSYRCDVWLCRPPLGDCRYWSLDGHFTGTIASLAATIGLSFFDLASVGLASVGLSSVGLSSVGLSSIGLASSGLSSSAGAGNGSSLRAPERVDRLGIFVGQSHHSDWFVLL